MAETGDDEPALVGGGDVVNFKVAFAGKEPVYVETSREVEVIVMGLALGLGTSVTDAQRLASQAREAIRASPLHHQWLAEDTWARIDRNDSGER